MVKTIESLGRGIDVVEALRECAPASLSDLYHFTGINRATLLRILATLQTKGWVYRALGDSRYRLSFTQTNRIALTDEALQLAELAAPVLHEAYVKLGWPIDIAVREGIAMKIAETTRTKAAFILNRHLMGYTPPFLFSAHGRAYLAFCPEQERCEILDSLRAKGGKEGRLARDIQWVARLLEQTRLQGYGVREPAYFGVATSGGQQVDAVAVPLEYGSALYGTMSMAWPQGAIEEVSVRDWIYPELCSAANEVLRRFNAAG